MINHSLLKSQAVEGDYLFVKDKNSLSTATEVYQDIYNDNLPQFETLKEISGVQILSTSDKTFLKNSPLHHHLVVKPSSEDLVYLEKAVQLLDSLDLKSWPILKNNLFGLLTVKLDPLFQTTDSQITSITLPGLPYISLISDKAYVHAPPSLILDEPNVVILAENIIHEATHQWVNLNLIDNDILSNQYSAEDSPKIEIPWRSKAFYPRDKQWPVDRCLHAAFVYNVVHEFRSDIHSRRSDISPYNESMIASAKKNARYLTNKMIKHTDTFTRKGLKIMQQFTDELC